MPALPVFNKEGKETDSLELPEKFFDGQVNQDVLHQAVVMYQASLRQGNASTKERGAVSGGGIKPWRQKGTGRARAGSTRAPNWQGGGVVFGPHPRDFGYSLSKKIRTVALRESLNAKFVAKELKCVKELDKKLSKTKEFAAILKALKLEGKILALLDGCDESVFRVSRNIPRFEVMRTQDVNAYDVLRHKTLVLTKEAFKKILKRLED